ncbi:MAG: N-acetyltransferase [Bacteroidetes bacterium]|nr:MAG: N-acetyltransferase [Bacteroidota bacterium]
MDLQPYLENHLVRLAPLKETDFEVLYKAASDPLIWELHPNPNRYQRDVFSIYFSGAIESKGAFLIIDAQTNEVIGSSRFYDYDANNSTVIIGYTFLKRSHWGGTYNKAVKKLMLDYTFQFVNQVYFHVGANNIRSQKAMKKLGAEKISQMVKAYHGEKETLNYIFVIAKERWI